MYGVCGLVGGEDWFCGYVSDNSGILWGLIWISL